VSAGACWVIDDVESVQVLVESAVSYPQPCECCCLSSGKFAVDIYPYFSAARGSNGESVSTIWLLHSEGGSAFVDLHVLCRFEFPYLYVNLMVYHFLCSFLRLFISLFIAWDSLMAGNPFHVDFCFLSSFYVLDVSYDFGDDILS
jgi:hypothetical protein